MLGKIEGKRRGQVDIRLDSYQGLNGHEFEQTLGDSEGQESLAWGNPWRHKEF